MRLSEIDQEIRAINNELSEARNPENFFKSKELINILQEQKEHLTKRREDIIADFN